MANQQGSGCTFILLRYNRKSRKTRFDTGSFGAYGVQGNVCDELSDLRTARLPARHAAHVSTPNLSVDPRCPPNSLVSSRASARSGRCIFCPSGQLCFRGRRGLFQCRILTTAAYAASSSYYYVTQR